MGRPAEDPDEHRREVDALDEPALEAPLLSGLAEAFPGFELLDSDLEFDPPHRIDYVGVDGNGRLTLVLRVRGEGHSPILRALDARDFARRHAGPLLRHVGGRRARTDLPPRVALIATGYEERLRRRLENLGDSGIEAFELRRLRSHSGELVFLAPLAPRAVPVTAPRAPSVDDFLDGLDEESRARVEVLRERLSRIDGTLSIERRGSGLSWRFGDEVLADVDVQSDGALRLAVAGRAPHTWRSAADLDGFLGDAVDVYLERHGARRAEPAARAARIAELAEAAPAAREGSEA